MKSNRWITLLLIVLPSPLAIADKQFQFIVDKPLTLVLENGSGNSVIEGVEGRKATVNYKNSNPKSCEVIVKQTQNILLTKVVQNENRSFWNSKGCTVDFKIQVPVNTSMILNTGSGNVKASGTLGKVEYKVGSGQVNIDARGIDQVLGESGSGGVTLNGLKGEGKVRSGSGNVELNYLAVPQKGSLEVQVGSGNVKVLVPPGSALNASLFTGSGEVINKVRPQPKGAFQVKMASGSGNLTIDLK